jgi:L-ascorbate metabolism protein UlaG (beta-lactamase superfamily)
MEHTSNKTMQRTIPTGFWSLMRDLVKGNANAVPKGEIPVVHTDLAAWQATGQDSLIWFGHSAYLIQLAGKVIFVDPMLASSYMPFTFLGGKRYSKQVPYDDALSRIDVVLITHNHYDHLNKASIRNLAHRTERFIVPIGVAPLLLKWGVAAEKVSTLDWWESCQVDGLTITGTPAQHFSGRGLFDRNKTNWNSYVVSSPAGKIYCGGDSGYGSHFTEIGRKFGPFAMTVMECGQYDPRWQNVHMLPEQSVQAHLDLRGEVMVPVHWAGFKLSLHDWNDPPRRVTKAASKAGVRLAIPQLGEVLNWQAQTLPSEPWWEME